MLGVLAFVASAGPGYLFVRLEELRRPRRKATPLEEAAEMVVIGSLATVAATLVVLAIADVVHLFDVDDLASEPGRYLATHPARTMLAAAGVLALSYGGVYGAVRLLFRGERPDIRTTGLHFGVLQQERPSNHGVLATVELRDGRALRGVVRALSWDEQTRDGEIVLKAPLDGPLLARDDEGNETPVPGDFILFDMADVLYIAGIYAPLVDDNA